jgi:hypothetical protein
VELLLHHYDERTNGHELFGWTSAAERVQTTVELSFVFTRILVRLYDWNRHLQRGSLQALFAA